MPTRRRFRLLGVSPADLETHGAVSETVACQMAAGALRASGADIAVAVTGIAGPDGGTPEKPVGTAWIGLAAKDEAATAFRVFHPRNRHDFKLAVSQAALDAVLAPDLLESLERLEHVAGRKQFRQDDGSLPGASSTFTGNGAAAVSPECFLDLGVGLGFVALERDHVVSPS